MFEIVIQVSEECFRTLNQIYSGYIFQERLYEVVVDHIRFSVRPKSIEICKVTVSAKQTEED
jgi:hypothetical protein